MTHRFFFLLNRAHRSVKTRLERETRHSLGLTSLELAALWALSSTSDLGVQDLARILFVDHAVVSRLSKQLVRKGVVERIPDPKDKRRTLLRISATGAEKAQRGQELLGHANAHLTQGFSDDELDTVARFLKHLINFGTEPGPLSAPPSHLGASHE